MAIHPTAVVSPNAEIGKNVEIGPYAVIDDDVRIGDDCFIDAHVKIGQYTTIGPRCRIYFGAFVGAEPQDHRFYKGIQSYTEIGSDTVIREYVTIHRPPFEFLKTTIGNHVLLMAFVHIGHDVIIGDRVTIANNTALSGHVQVGQGAVFSGCVLVHQFCRIGALAMVGPGAHVGQDIPPFCMLRESNVITGPNTIGLRRAGMSNEQRLAIRRAIRTFFFEGLNAKNALEQIERGENVLPEVHMFVNFIKESHRGIMPGNPKFVGISDEQRELIESQTT
ncbi:MAG: acyl-ACP--UDP-N-acetylglucosamine O-acyltransferase [Victivallales bacterium]|nr:acyl-[acyl-carrier-protein]--UDP-N-acetylglucosamine O-acyltransferase [Lentisphaeria bacterium]HCG48147.1 acyl-[acyl-carrier-protein]--UDP-N-acetylglucosamine O-acyltransferase [Lentisphaeria bacterium]